MSRVNRPLGTFLGLLGSHWAPLAAATASGLAALLASVGLLALAGWFLASTALAGLAPAAAPLFNFFFPSAGVRACAIARTLARYAERVLAHEATFRLLASLRVWFYQRLEPLAPAVLLGHRSGDLLNRIVADIDALDNLYLRVLAPGAAALGMALLLGAGLWWLAPPVALVTLAALGVAGVAVPAGAQRAGVASGVALARTLADLRVQVVEGLQGLAELLVFGRGGAWLDDLAAHHRRLGAIQRRMSHIRGAAAAAVTASGGLAAVAALFLGAELVARGGLSGPHLALLTLAVLTAFEAVVPLPAAFQYLGRTREAGRRLLEVVESPPAVVFPPDGAPPPARWDLAFEGVGFAYHPQGPPVLADVTLRVPEGARLAVLGPTGAGKSTLGHLLVRFWDPTTGCIRLGGRNLRHLAEAHLRRSIAVVAQQPHLFNASIRENLRLAAPDAPEAHLWEALAAAELADFVRGLPWGLDTWVGEGGGLISGGQAQRLALARAVLQAAPVWLLDEPTEGLDRATAIRLLERVLRLTQGKTVLLITHRPTALEKMDAVAVLENGRIVEQGAPGELARMASRFAALARRQAI
jgi:ATP-binding cassette subfamily C protein CydC